MQTFRSFPAACLILILLLGCGGGNSEVANITFDGSRYLGGVASDFSIHATDLSAAGEASEVRAAVKGRTVFMLSGVDEGDAVVMEPADPSADYYIFFREGVGTPGVPMSSVIEGLCRYLDEPPADCG